jgi:hypothetical protein
MLGLHPAIRIPGAKLVSIMATIDSIGLAYGRGRRRAPDGGWGSATRAARWLLGRVGYSEPTRPPRRAVWASSAHIRGTCASARARCPILSPATPPGAWQAVAFAPFGP